MICYLLLDALEPGLCPNHRSLDGNNGLDNATRGINLGYGTVPPSLSLSIHPSLPLSSYRDVTL